MVVYCLIQKYRIDFICSVKWNKIVDLLKRHANAKNKTNNYITQQTLMELKYTQKSN